MLQLLQPLQSLQEGLPQLLQPGHLALDNFGSSTLEVGLSASSMPVPVSGALASVSGNTSASDADSDDSSLGLSSRSFLPHFLLLTTPEPFRSSPWPFPPALSSVFHKAVRVCPLVPGPISAPSLLGPGRHTGPGAVTDRDSKPHISS